MSDDGAEITIAVETTATVVGCPGCESGARAKDRRWVALPDAPLPDRAVRLRWRMRICSCPESACEVRTLTVQHDLAEPRRVLTRRAARVGRRRVRPEDLTTLCGVRVAVIQVWTALRSV